MEADASVYGREVTTPGDEIDEGLAELNQKKTR